MPNATTLGALKQIAGVVFLYGPPTNCCCLYSSKM